MLLISFFGETTCTNSSSLHCRRSARKAAPYVTIECYFDDSSDQRREKYYACAGLLGSAYKWDSLNALWSLETHELRKPFRASECECGHGQFEDWPRAKRNDLMRRLTGVIYRRNLYGFVSIVPLEAYKEVFPDCGQHDAFLLAATQTIMNMAYLAHTMRKDAALWFESCETNVAINAVFDSVVAFKEWRPARHLRSISFEVKRVYGLQAADLVAREAFKYIDDRGMWPPRKPLLRLKDVLCFTVWNRQALGYLASSGGQSNLGLLATWDAHSEAPRLDHFWKNF
jgi:hypothetical protein